MALLPFANAPGKSTGGGSTGPTGPTGNNGTTGPTGTQYPWQGAWTNGNSYNINDCVDDVGNGYVCIAANTASATYNEPSSGASGSTFWSLLVQRGSTGPTGSQGIQGTAGSQGIQGTAGSQGIQGTAGSQGIQGTAGANGNNGTTGPTGPTGSTGSAGSPLPRVASTTTSATPTPATDSTDVFELTAQSATASFGVPTGTPVDGQKLIIQIIDGGSSESISWSQATGGYTGGGSALPLVTVASKYLHIGFMYVTANSLNRWLCIATSQQ